MEEIKKITINDESYPQELKEIAKPPQVLYYKGNIKIKGLKIAIVGTRRYSSYGKQITIDIAAQLAQAGIIIVSGLAPGIDTFAHQSATEQGKKTISVLGTGLDEKSIYPKENIQLARKILDLGGCLISEYPIGTAGSKFTFPQRNRIISGLCSGVLIVEAKERSGSLITADYALGQKRKLFAVPGSIYSLNSQGPHKLIKRGAVLVDKADDILRKLNLSGPAALTDAVVKTQSPEQNLIIEILKQEELHLDKIIEKTKLDPAKAVSTLTILEIEGKIKNLGGNIYILCQL